ncbi:MAG TPA: copper transporter [Acidimicrobiales bacterium]|jgi:hypothetical protein|nr:copper transporter [Acidimicrobiales bacterium]
MINLRYHVVSIVAVFLALAIGIAMGSTVISKATVADLRTRISKAENGISQTKQENSLLQSQLNSLNSANGKAIDRLVPLVVGDRLTDVPVVVVATPAVDSSYLRQAQATLVAAGVRLEATITIDDRLGGIGSDHGNRQKLADLVESSSTTSSGTSTPSATRLWTRTADVLGAELRTMTQAPPPPAAPAPGDTTSPDTSSTTTTTAPAAQSSLLADLQEAGFVHVDPTNSRLQIAQLLATRGVRVVVLGEPETPPGSATSTGVDGQFIVPLLRAITRSGPAPLVVGSFADPDPAKASTPDTVRDWFLGPIRDDKSLDGRLSTVNDLELFAGQLALVLALADVEKRSYGHYGLGSGATALAPTGS